MAVDPATAKAIAKVASVVVSEEKAKKTVLSIIIGIVVTVLIVLAIPVYILSNPLSAFGNMFSQDSAEMSLIQKFKKDYDQFMPNGNAPTDQPVQLVGDLAFPHCGNPTISSPFGYRVNPVTGEYKLHAGIDLSGERHSNIVSVADGTVILSRVNGGYGNCIKIVHKDKEGKTFYSLYGHLYCLYVKEGEKVKRGQVIAKEGGQPGVDPNPGSSTGHHLHFEIHDSSDTPVDPYPYIYKN